MKLNVVLAASIILGAAGIALFVAPAQPFLPASAPQSGVLPPPSGDFLADEEVPSGQMASSLDQLLKDLQNILERLQGATERHHDLADRVQEQIDIVEDEGIDIVLVDGNLEEAQVLIVEAERALGEAEDALIIIMQAPQPWPWELFRVLQERVRHAMEQLRLAQLRLLEALEELRRARGERPPTGTIPDVSPSPSASPAASPSPTPPLNLGFPSFYE